jgi:peptidoglycan/LPS O-acetylase OafA/YrhL
MSHTKLLGVITILPLLHVTLFVGGMYSFLLEPGQFSVLFLIHSAVIVLMLILLTYYLVQVVRHTELAPLEKLLWVCALIAGNILAMPVYWYRHVYTNY